MVLVYQFLEGLSEAALYLMFMITRRSVPQMCSCFCVIFISIDAVKKYCLLLIDILIWNGIL
jgi:hypothetical protein